jgi:hypothetical protein
LNIGLSIGQLAPAAIGTFELVRIPVQVVGDDSLKTEPKGFWRNWLGRILGGEK